jgi:hypothetical protein
LAFGALFIKQRLGLTDEETVKQIRENAYMEYSRTRSGGGTAHCELQAC